MASISIRNLHKSFDKVQVLRDINLEVHEGEFISLLGSSGCGKSTLLRIIAGLEHESGGELLIGGNSMRSVPPKDRSVSMVFQSYALYPHLTVYENMALPLIMRRLTRFQRLPILGRRIGNAAEVRGQIRQRVVALAESLDIATLLDRRPSQLSGGQRQRVALGRAMVRKPKVFLMDEPLSNLDTKMRAHMRTELSELHRDLGATFVYVTHDQEEAMTMSDRVALMMDGHIMQLATPREIYSHPAHVKVAEFIGAPKINILPTRRNSSGVVESFGVPLGSPQQGTEKGFVGIRPSRLGPAAAEQESWPARVVNVEDLGSTYLVHSLLAEEVRVISRMDSMEKIPAIGEVIQLAPREGSAIFFNEDGYNVNQDTL